MCHSSSSETNGVCNAALITFLVYPVLLSPLLRQVSSLLLFVNYIGGSAASCLSFSFGEITSSYVIP